MDEVGILDMDELAIEHSELEFQDEVKDVIRSGAESDAQHVKSKKSKKRDFENKTVERNDSAKSTANVAVISDVNLLDSFQPVKRTHGSIKRNGKL